MFAPVGSDQASSETKTKIAAIKAGIPVRMLPDSSVELLEDQRFHVTNMPGVNISVDVPAGFVCDGASIPRCFWMLVGHPLEGGPLRAAITHDWLCSHAKTRSERRFADTIFMWILALEKVPWIRRVMMFLAVRGYATFVWKPGSDE